MSDKYIIDDEGEYLINTETNDMWDATGGGDGIYMLVGKVNRLLAENAELKERNRELAMRLSKYEKSIFDQDKYREKENIVYIGEFDHTDVRFGD